MPAAEVNVHPVPAARIVLDVVPAAGVDLVPAANVVIDPLTDGLVVDDVPVAADVPLGVGAAGFVPVANLRDRRIAILGETLVVGEARFGLAGALVLLFAALGL